MQFIYIPTFTLIALVATFFAVAGLLYLFAGKQVSFWRVVGAYGLFVLSNGVLFFVCANLFALWPWWFPGHPSFLSLSVSLGAQAVFALALSLGAFHFFIQWFLKISWQRTLVMFVVVFMIINPLLRYGAHLATTPLFEVPVIQAELDRYAQKEMYSVMLPFNIHRHAGESYLIVADLGSIAVSNWQMIYVVNFLKHGLSRSPESGSDAQLNSQRSNATFQQFKADFEEFLADENINVADRDTDTMIVYATTTERYVRSDTVWSWSNDLSSSIESDELREYFQDLGFSEYPMGGENKEEGFRGPHSGFKQYDVIQEDKVCVTRVLAVESSHRLSVHCTLVSDINSEAERVEPFYLAYDEPTGTGLLLDVDYPEASEWPGYETVDASAVESEGSAEVLFYRKTGGEWKLFHSGHDGPWCEDIADDLDGQRAYVNSDCLGESDMESGEYGYVPIGEYFDLSVPEK